MKKRPWQRVIRVSQGVVTIRKLREGFDRYVMSELRRALFGGRMGGVVRITSDAHGTWRLDAPLPDRSHRNVSHNDQYISFICEDAARVVFGRRRRFRVEVRRRRKWVAV